MSESWHLATVTEVSASAEGLFTIRLSAPAEVHDAYARPGQFLSVGVDEAGEGYFALASKPQQRPLELLVRAGNPLSDALIAARAGDGVRVSMPLGAGFPLEHGRGKHVLLFATGSGMGAMRALLLTVLEERSAYGEVRLYFGARSPTGFAYLDELPGWEAAGVKVVRTVSKPGTERWSGLTGYVQNHLGPLPSEGAVAFLVGHPAMVAEVTHSLEQRGLSRESVFLNH